MNEPVWEPLSWAAQRWTFDLWSALIGAVVGAVVVAVLAILLYVYRAALGSAWQAARAQTRQLLDKLTAGVETRYYDGLLSYVATFEVLPHAIPLEPLYVAPRFVSPPPRPSLTQVEPLPPRVILGPVWQATRRLLVTGPAGSGRTALLIHLARTFAGQNRQNTYEPGQKFIPIYIHLVELSSPLASLPATESPDTAEKQKRGASDDPAVLLMANVKSHASALIAGNLDSSLRTWLRSGQALVLLDGLDELGPLDQTRAMVWIGKLVERYPEPRYVVAAPERGYGLLAEAGFVALPLAKWEMAEINDLARRWGQVLQRSSEDAARLAVALKPVPGTAPLPADLTIAALVWQKDGSVPATRSAIYNQMVDGLLEKLAGQEAHAASKLSPLLNRAALGRLATTLLKEARPLATRAEIEKIAAELLASDVKPTGHPQESATGEPAPVTAHFKAPRGTAEAVDALIKSHLLTARGHDLYAFAHRRLQCYLAAWNLAQRNDMATLLERLDDPDWADVFEFCAGMMNMTPLVEAYLKREDDLFRTRLWAVAAWAVAAPPEAAWRGRVLGEVARTWMQPNQLSPIRERALLGLISTQDKGLPYLFKKSLKSPDAQVRAQAARGLGFVGQEADLVAFMNILSDSELAVREAAIRAFGLIPGDTTLEGLVDILLQADEPMRQAAAETLVQKGEKGIKILRDAVKEDDLLVRRAAAYGLGRTGEPWAIELLTKLEQEDPQWVVRSAATDALRLAHKAEHKVELNLSPVRLEEQGWLVEWGATRGLSVGLGRSALPVLLKALAEGDTPARLAAIHTLAYIGDDDAIGPLRQALKEPDATIQTEAMHAIAEISARTGKSVPA